MCAFTWATPLSACMHVQVVSKLRPQTTHDSDVPLPCGILNKELLLLLQHGGVPLDLLQELMQRVAQDVW